MSTKRRSRPNAPAQDSGAGELTFEAALERLEALVERLEEGKIPLEESLAAYVEGTRLVRRCQERLEHAEAVIRELTETQEGFTLGPSSLEGEDDDDDGEDDEDDEEA